LHKKKCLCCCPFRGIAQEQNKKYRLHALMRRRRHHRLPLCFVSYVVAQKRNIHVAILFAELRCSKTKNNDNAL
jgi:hypothetical protein